MLAAARTTRPSRRILDLGLGHGAAPATVRKQLVDLANAYGGHDDASVQLLVLGGCT